jgi:hypothetical protein
MLFTFGTEIACALRIQRREASFFPRSIVHTAFLTTGKSRGYMEGCIGKAFYPLLLFQFLAFVGYPGWVTVFTGT